MNEKNSKSLDMSLMIVPFVVISIIGATFFIMPEAATNTLYLIREFMNTWFSSWFAVLGVAGIVISIYVAASPIGKIRLGSDKREFSRFHWGAMVFTGTMGADVVFYSIHEWAYYVGDPYVESLGGSAQDWVSTFPLFHWGPTVWAFYLIMGVALSFMIYVRGRRSRRISEACRPILGKRVDGFWGRIIDLLTIITIIAGIASSFAMSTPMIANLIGDVFGFTPGTSVCIGLLVTMCIIYSISAWIGLDAISKSSSICVYLFMGLLAYVFLVGGRAMYSIETGITAIGNLAQNFIRLSTQVDPLRTTCFPQNWTLFYWAYWLTWCVGGPFFIAQISRGKTIREIIVEGYSWGVAGTWISFIILGSYAQSLQMIDGMDLTGMVFSTSGESMVLAVLHTLPLGKIVCAVLAVVMVLFFTTSLDSVSLVTAAFCHRNLDPDDLPKKPVRLFWSILLIVMPIALLFAEGSLSNIQSVSVIAALPISFVLLIATASFIKDAKGYLKERSEAKEE